MPRKSRRPLGCTRFAIRFWDENYFIFNDLAHWLLGWIAPGMVHFGQSIPAGYEENGDSFLLLER